MSNRDVFLKVPTTICYIASVIDIAIALGSKSTKHALMKYATGLNNSQKRPTSLQQTENIDPASPPALSSKSAKQALMKYAAGLNNSQEKVTSLQQTENIEPAEKQAPTIIPGDIDKICRRVKIM